MAIERNLDWCFENDNHPTTRRCSICRNFVCEVCQPLHAVYCAEESPAGPVEFLEEPTMDAETLTQFIGNMDSRIGQACLAMGLGDKKEAYDLLTSIEHRLLLLSDANEQEKKIKRSFECAIGLLKAHWDNLQ